MKKISGKLFSIKDHYQWIILILGVLMFCASIYYSDYNTFWWWLLLNRTGEILIIGVLVGFLSSHKVIISNYRNELEKLLFDSRMLRNRSDIDVIWSDVTKQLFKSKFPKLHSKLLPLIKNNYLPTNEISYYSNHDDTIDVSWVNKETGDILVQQTTEFTLIAETINKFTFEQSNWLTVAPSCENDYEQCYKIEMKTDNDCKSEVNRSYDANKNCLKTTSKLKLAGKTEYRIIKTIEKRYNINLDYHISFRAKYITDQVSVCLSLPSDIDHIFIESGTKVEFEKKTSPKFWKYEYKDLVLPRQGYIIILKPKNTI